MAPEVPPIPVILRQDEWKYLLDHTYEDHDGLMENLINDLKASGNRPVESWALTGSPNAVEKINDMLSESGFKLVKVGRTAAMDRFQFQRVAKP